MHREQSERFKERFGVEAERCFFAPGRVNIIGEHTDYNGGFVFPGAISKGTYAYATKRKDRQCRFYSENFHLEDLITVTLDDLSFSLEHDWVNYPKSVLAILQKHGYEPTAGYDIYFVGNIPNGAGLSSSASIELVMATLLNEWEGWNLSKRTLVQFCQQAENEYIGVQSGIMDQFAVGFGKKGHAMLLDCQTLDYEYAPIPTEDYSLIIMNSNKARTLAGSAYNDRRRECEEALQDLQAHLPIQALGEISMEQWEKWQHTVKNEVTAKRAKHVIAENERTKIAVQRLKTGDWQQFGELLNESHQSLRDDYEVTGKELDTLISLAWEQPGVIGARMTGAGFGGCAIAFVDKTHVNLFLENVAARYSEVIGYEASFYEAEVGDGAKELILEKVSR
ncbi:galactokinase [Geomicrobium halophilum]|uniref:Galactokinase n=1 Tax=Geomicrobium halophilum TaxID=549000 RepID=A0A841PQ92_9BACL|nr:galactokinase [Geomicrobium halophilum]MBB6450940.1 galactokinase [Geomicrobium halophilum]